MAADGRFDASRLGAVPARIKRALDQRQRRVLAPVPPVAGTDRLVPAPVFLLSSVRSGSTLLRVILDSHSDIHAPHEMHLGSLRVTVASWYGEIGIEQLGLQVRELENLLWDRVMHLELGNTRKSILVDKTPYNTIDWKRISSSWPHARFLFLTRHPVRVYQSLAASRPDLPSADHYEKVVRYTGALAAARAALPGVTVRYEDLTARSETVVRDLCSWLDVPFEPGMLRYGEHRHRDYRRGVGDWGDKINSGSVQPSGPGPEEHEIPDELRRSCELLGYL